MHRSDERSLVECAACGANVDIDLGRSFALGPASALCFECALERGGRFDEATDSWVETPSLSDVAQDDH